MAGSSAEPNHHFCRCRNHNPHRTGRRCHFEGLFRASEPGPASKSRTRQADPTGLLAATVEALAGKVKPRLSWSPWPDPFPEFSHLLRSHHYSSQVTRAGRLSSSCLGSLLRQILRGPSVKNKSPPGVSPLRPAFPSRSGYRTPRRKEAEPRRPQPYHRFQKRSRSSQEGKRDTCLVLMKEKGDRACPRKPLGKESESGGRAGHLGES